VAFPGRCRPPQSIEMCLWKCRKLHPALSFWHGTLGLWARRAVIYRRVPENHRDLGAEGRQAVPFPFAQGRQNRAFQPMEL
jgi:hypothetical protein